jgi:membrane protein
MQPMARRIWVFTKQTFLSYNRDQCAQHAAAIAYHVLFSIIPLSIFGVSIAAFVLSDDSLRTHFINSLLDALPLSQTEGRDSIDNAIEDARSIGGPIAVISLAALLWTASSMFGAVRKALNAVYKVDEYRPYFRGKLVDLLQIGIVSLILLSSIAATGLLRTAREVSVDFLGPLGSNNALWEIPALVLPALISLATFLLLYRFVPAAHPRWRDVVPGALLATLLFEVLKNSFALYVANFNNYDVIYGSLAGVLLFLLYTYLSSIILLIGAEFSHTFQRFHSGDLAAELHPVGPRKSFAEETLRAVRGLFVRQPQ